MTESDQGLILSILSDKFSDFFVGFSDFLKKIPSFEKCRPLKKEGTVKILEHIKFLKLPNAEGGLVKKNYFLSGSTVCRKIIAVHPQFITVHPVNFLQIFPRVC